MLVHPSVTVTPFAPYSREPADSQTQQVSAKRRVTFFSLNLFFHQLKNELKVTA